jgi:polar amino acid transport system substrate-binding protein
MKRMVFLLFAITLLSGCLTTSVDPDPSILRVGVSPRSQPMVFKQNGQIMGIEADFAHKLGEAMNREVVFIETAWDKLIEDLEQNKIDIIMSNMSITAPRSIRINFATPYMKSGLTALFRRDSANAAGLMGNVIMNQNKRVGFVRNTTGQFFTKQQFIRAELVEFSSSAAAVTAMKNGKLEMFVSDAPVVWWLAAVNESDLLAFPELLNVEPLAWGIGKHNMALLEEVNVLISQWDKDGTSRKIMRNWIPHSGR